MCSAAQSKLAAQSLRIATIKKLQTLNEHRCSFVKEFHPGSLAETLFYKDVKLQRIGKTEKQIVQVLKGGITV